MILADSVRIAAPWMLLVMLLFVPALVIELRKPGAARSVALAGVRDLQSSLPGFAARRRFYRAVTLALMVVMLGLLWANPALQSSQPVLMTDQLAQQKNIMLAIDVSRSMSGPLEVPDKEARFAAYGKAPEDMEPRQTRYEAARDTVYRFIERFPDARIGLILFSTEPFLAR